MTCSASNQRSHARPGVAVGDFACDSNLHVFATPDELVIMALPSPDTVQVLSARTQAPRHQNERVVPTKLLTEHQSSRSLIVHHFSLSPLDAAVCTRHRTTICFPECKRPQRIFSFFGSSSFPYQVQRRILLRRQAARWWRTHGVGRRTRAGAVFNPCGRRQNLLLLRPQFKVDDGRLWQLGKWIGVVKDDARHGVFFESNQLCEVRRADAL